MTSKTLALKPNRPFSVSEVAAVTEVEIKKINRFIDDRVLPASTYRRKRRERTVYSFACPIVGFYSSEAGSSLTKEARREVADWLAGHLKSKWNEVFILDAGVDDSKTPMAEYDRILEDQLELMDVKSVFGPDALKFSKGEMVLDLEESVNRSLKCIFKLRLAESLMIEDADIRGGITTIRGTRISPYEAAGMALSDGIESAMEDYPSLTRNAFELAILYSRANPLRGRPNTREGDWLKDWRLVSRTVVSLNEFPDQDAK